MMTNSFGTTFCVTAGTVPCGNKHCMFCYGSMPDRPGGLINYAERERAEFKRSARVVLNRKARRRAKALDR